MASGISTKVKIENYDSLMTKLTAMGVDARPLVQAQMTKATRWVRDDARLRCPVDTGDLRKSIRPKVEKTNGGAIGTVYTNMEYAAYVEFGTGQRGQATNKERGISYSQNWIGQEAQPYLYPALKENERDIMNHFFINPLKERLREACRRNI